MKRSTIAVLTAAVTATSLAIVPGAPVAHGADAGAGTSCTPTSRIIDAPAGSAPRALSAAGHVVTRAWLSDISRLRESLHAPDGTVTDIVDGDRTAWGAADINGRGVVAGTGGYRSTTGVTVYRPWVFRHGHVRLLATPGKLGEDVRKDYTAIAVNAHSAVVGVKDNGDRFPRNAPEYVARPVLWPTPASTPIKLDLPNGFNVGDPYQAGLVDLLNDGTITAVLADGEGRYHLALWVTPGAAPDLRPLPDTWMPTALAGQWVMGRIGSPTDRVFLSSWTEAFAIDGPEPLSVNDVSSTGTFTVGLGPDTQTPAEYVGGPTQPVAQLGGDVRAYDVVGTDGGQVLVQRDGMSVEVITCALALPVATDITVTPVQLPATKVSP